MDQDPIETPEAVAVDALEAPEGHQVPTGADAPADLGEAIAGDGQAPEHPEHTGEATPDVTPARPREVIKGIHPLLLCNCEECEPDHVELQWFSVDELRKVKGTAMLFCAHSSRKYFSPVEDLQKWLTANPLAVVKGRKSAS
ncbi:MAG: hypothetical protein JWM80_237 [Cyanobacteria bacterium RYN_339]|nr:hypothetical protein [Cyanobacteria bacterium RYN_339]